MSCIFNGFTYIFLAYFSFVTCKISVLFPLNIWLDELEWLCVDFFSADEAMENKRRKLT